MKKGSIPGRRDAEATRERLLGAGAELFAARGFEGTRVDAIARRAGVNKALVSYHFGGKAGLYGAIVAASLGEAESRLRALRQDDRPAMEALQEFVRVFAATAESRPELPAMILREVLSNAEHLERSLLPHLLEIFGGVRAILARGMRNGDFRRLDPLEAHLAIIGALIFFFATRPFRERIAREGKLPEGSPTVASYVAHLEEFIRRGLAPTPPTDGRA